MTNLKTTNRISRDIIERHKRLSETYERAALAQLSVWDGDCPIQEQPLLLRCYPEGYDEGVPHYDYMEIHNDHDKMLLSGLCDTLGVIYGNAGAVPSIRANMGCGIFPTLFGVRQRLFEDKMPWVTEHLSKEQLSRMSARDLCIGDEFDTALKHMEFIAESISGSGVRVYPPDLQGAFDTAHIVYGDDIFYDLYDDPGFVHHILDLSCEAIFLGMKEALARIPGAETAVAHYNSLLLPRDKGGVKISEDTSTLLTEEHIKTFVSPYLKRILEHFGGGYVHYCGKNPHLFSEIMDTPLVFGINFGNPEKHDMVETLRVCAAKNIVYYGDISAAHGESTDGHFNKLLGASLKPDGGSVLLLSMSCDSIAERDDILSDWNEAVKIYQK